MELTLPNFSRGIDSMTKPKIKSLRHTARKPQTSAAPFAGRAAGEIAGQNVRAWRERRGLTLHQLGRRSGVSPNTIDRLERGSSDQSLFIRASIAAGLSVPMCQLWTQGEKMFKKMSRRRLKRARAFATD
jgi:DNA-binding XRE family transcriptional regulator